MSTVPKLHIHLECKENTKKLVNFEGFRKEMSGWLKAQIVAMEKYTHKYFPFRTMCVYVCVCLNNEIGKGKMAKNDMFPQQKTKIKN